jgi:hypothetical protein
MRDRDGSSLSCSLLGRAFGEPSREKRSRASTPLARSCRDGPPSRDPDTPTSLRESLADVMKQDMRFIPITMRRRDSSTMHKPSMERTRCPRPWPLTRPVVGPSAGESRLRPSRPRSSGQRDTRSGLGCRVAPARRSPGVGLGRAAAPSRLGFSRPPRRAPRPPAPRRRHAPTPFSPRRTRQGVRDYNSINLEKRCVRKVRFRVWRLPLRRRGPVSRVGAANYKPRAISVLPSAHLRSEAQADPIPKGAPSRVGPTNGNL